MRFKIVNFGGKIGSNWWGFSVRRGQKLKQGQPLGLPLSLQQEVLQNAKELMQACETYYRFLF